jgi:transcription initiation factor TFIIIB Brf1 subunit/transcription initiation factor TFIIB
MSVESFELCENEIPDCIKYAKKTSKKSIKADLENYNIPDNIKYEAEMWYQKYNQNKTKRANKRKDIVASSIYNAYEKIGNSKDPSMIARLTNISKNRVNKAINTRPDTDDLIEQRFHFPQEYINDFLKYLNVNEKTEIEVTNFCNNICKSNSMILDDCPQVTAAAVILFFMDTYSDGVENKKMFYKFVDKSEVTVTKSYNKISDIHHNM